LFLVVREQAFVFLVVPVNHVFNYLIYRLESLAWFSVENGLAIANKCVEFWVVYEVFGCLFAKA